MLFFVKIALKNLMPLQAWVEFMIQGCTYKGLAHRLLQRILGQGAFLFSPLNSILAFRASMEFMIQGCQHKGILKGVYPKTSIENSGPGDGKCSCLAY